MECSACEAVNPAGKRFCGECGSLLAVVCIACEAPNPPKNRFCGECGSQFGQHAGVAPTNAAMAAPATAQQASAPVAQRRVCSVLFADLVGFTPLTEARDPEEVRELLTRYFEMARTVVTRYGGVIEKFIGDAVMAVWGTPVAAEGDAERAVRAAMDLADAVDQLGRDSGAAGLAARAGVVTGSVAVTLGATGEGMVAGDAVNTAARVQAAADSGAVLVDEATWRIASAAVAFTAVGKFPLKGKASPVSLWRAERVLSGVGGTQRIDGLEARFVGRDAELRLVKDLFHTCIERASTRLVSITGAAGVGKSRLGWEFEKYVDGLASTVRWHRGRCLSYGEGVAFWALAEMVRQRFDIAEEDPSPVAAEKLANGLPRWVTDSTERDYVHPRLAQLLGTESPGAAPALAREELFAGWRLFFERLAASEPVVLVVEDLQHADAGLLDFLEHLLDWSRDVPIFVLTLARPELETRRDGWGIGRRNSTTLTIDPLSQAAMDELLEELVPGMPEAAKLAIAARAEGVPLYAVETVRMLIDRDVVQPIGGVYRLVGDVGELAVPASLQSLLAARLDALPGNAQRLVAAAAVLGGTFPADALIAVSDQPEEEVRRLLTELVRREVLAVRADPLSPQRGQYGFVQTMFRQVAYDTLSRRDRKAGHLAVAAHLQGAFAEEGEEIAEVIATHLLDALAAVPDDPDVPNLRKRAVEMLVRAGERAERTGAPESAITTYVRAADLHDQVGTAEHELAAAALRDRAGQRASDTGHFAEAQQYYHRTIEVYQRHGRERETARTQTRLAQALRRQGRLDDAHHHLTAALATLEPQQDGDTVNALAEFATLQVFAGQSAEADRLSARAFALAQALDLPSATLTGLFIIRGLAHDLANRHAQAAANFREAQRRAEAEQNSAGTAQALVNLANVLVSSDPQAAAEAAESALRHSRRIGYRFHLAMGSSNLIQALLMTGDWARAKEIATAAALEGIGDESIVVSVTAVLLHALRGDAAALEPALLALDRHLHTEDLQDRAATACALAAVERFRGNLPEALEQARRALELAPAVGLRSDPFRWAWPIAADAAVALGQQEETQRLLDWLDSYPPGDIPVLLGVDRLRVRARLLALQGSPDAASAFDSAVAALRALGSPYHLAVGLLDQSEYLTTNGSPADALSLVAEAHEIGRRLGALSLSARAQRCLDDISAVPEDRSAVAQ